MLIYKKITSRACMERKGSRAGKNEEASERMKRNNNNLEGELKWGKFNRMPWRSENFSFFLFVVVYK